VTRAKATNFGRLYLESYIRSAQVFRTPKNHCKFLGIGRLTRSNFHTEKNEYQAPPHEM